MKGVDKLVYLVTIVVWVDSFWLTVSSITLLLEDVNLHVGFFFLASPGFSNKRIEQLVSGLSTSGTCSVQKAVKQDEQDNFTSRRHPTLH